MLDKSVLKELSKILGKDHLLTTPADLALYGYDATPAAEITPPDAVVLPGSAEEVQRIVQLANRVLFPVIPRGAGTNLTGGTLPVRGGVVLSTQRMNRIVGIDTENLQAVVQPGVVTEDLHDQVEELRLFYPPDPQSKETCTIGGNLAENAGGPRAVKYGVTRNYVLGIQAVLPTGELTRLGARTVKSVAGYDLVSLLVGSEGTLGIITEATLRLIPLPQARGTLLAVFGEMAAAAGAVAATFQAGVLPSAIEFIDKECIRCVEEYEPSGLPTDAGAVLVVEVDGGQAEVTHLAGRVERVMKEHGAREVRISADQQHADTLWKARRAVGPSLARIAPIKVNEDVVVPLTNLPRAIGEIHKIAARHDLPCACFGHAGDGNIHVNFLAQPDDQDDMRRVEEAVSELFDLVISLDGSITGEHGVGTTKQAFLPRELSDDALQAMARIKQALDPKNIMNPGKIFAPQTSRHKLEDSLALKEEDHGSQD
jgi:glycolate oxidase